MNRPSPRRGGGVCAVATAGLVLGCAVGAGPGPEQPAPPEGPVLDPVGAYDLTMSSESLVSEGRLEVRGTQGSYAGRISVGGTVAGLRMVEVGVGQLSVQAAMPSGTLVLRLVGDADYLSGNWVLGSQRGTVVARKRAGSRRRTSLPH